MSKFAPYSNYWYLSIIKEAIEWVPVVPTNFLRILAESIETNFGVSDVQEIAWSRERNIRSVQNQIDISWDVEFYVESKMIWHFLRWVYWAPITQILTAWTAFRHTFKVTDTPETYTIDMKPADAPWVHRYFWVQITALAFEWDDNKIKCTASIMPRKAFINARVKESVNSWTTLTIDQTAWLTTDDTILVLDKADWFTTLKELTIVSIDSDTQLTTDTIDVQLDEKDLVVIKKSTATYDQDRVYTWLGGSEVYTWENIDNVLIEKKEAFTLNYLNEVEARFFGWCEESARFAWDVLVKWYSWSGTVDKFFDDESNLDKLRKNEKFGFRLLTKWETEIETNSLIKSSSTWGATANWFKVEATTGWKAGNDISITTIINDSDALEATKDGNTYTIKLASTTAANNTWTLIAAALDALTWIDATAEWTWAEEFTTAEDSQNLWFRIDSTWAEAWTNVVWRDVNETTYLQFDNAWAKMDTFTPSSSEDDILMEEIPMKFYKDVESGDNSKKWSTRISLVNTVSSY